MDLTNHSIHAWINKHNIKTETGTPLDFYDHLYMFDIYNDWSPRLVCMKAAQVTFSTMAIIKSLWIAKHKGIDIIYTLPSQSDVTDFVNAKVNRIVDANPILQEYVKDRDTIEQKRVGDNILYYRGTWTNRAAIAVSADLTVFDEVDRSNMPVIEQYSSRLQHSKYAWQWYFSNPSYEGHGVNKYWEMSDKRHWFITCAGCSKEQYLDWPESIDPQRRCFQCKFCKKELTRNERRIGKWKKMKTSYEPTFTGYWISLLMAPWVTAEEILTLYKTKDAEYFDNFVLGKPHIGSGNKVMLKDLTQNLTQDVNPQDGRVVIGVDTGLGIHLVAGNHRGIFYYNSSESYDEFEELMSRFPNAIAVFDAHGDLHKPRELQEKYKGRLFLCYYQQDRKSSDLIRWEDDIVRVDRNRMIQLVVDEFRGKRIPLFGTESDWYDFFIHWRSIYREEEETSLGVKKRIWKRSAADHLVHATSYWRTGMDRFGRPPGGEIIKPTSIFTGVEKGVEVDYNNKARLIMPDPTYGGGF